MKSTMLSSLLLLSLFTYGQNTVSNNHPVNQAPADTITAALLKTYLTFLSSDQLQGRGSYTYGLYQAANFIYNRFSDDSLLADVQPVTHNTQKNDSINLSDYESVMMNIIATLPGKERKDEIIIFCAHYDHVGTIYNGANDNASGTSALLALAHYFALKKDNRRTLMFCAFTGEEIGLAGSGLFAPMMPDKNVKAVINLEMLGRHGAVGPKAFFVTGSGYSTLSYILEENLTGTGVKLNHEPSPDKMLFERSDNYSFYQQGMIAHTIMCSDDDDACYHKPCDDIDRLDIPNMAIVIKAIATACRTLIAGTDTPVKGYKSRRKWKKGR